MFIAAASTCPDPVDAPRSHFWVLPKVLGTATSCTMFLFLWRLGAFTEDGTGYVKLAAPHLWGEFRGD